MALPKTPQPPLEIPPVPDWLPAPVDQGPLRARFATTSADVETALRLRYEVFNLELGEGLDTSHMTGRDEDRFDRGCHHLLVEDRRQGQVVGTYRLQTAEMAARHEGFYSAGEFRLDTLPSEIIGSSVEVGRACIVPAYRNRRARFLLWRALARYMAGSGKLSLFGCCSLTSQDPEEGLRADRWLRREGHVSATLRAEAQPGIECTGEPSAPEEDGPYPLPILFRTYLRYGAEVISPPVIDREFKTIDFLVLLDVRKIPAEIFHLYFREGEIPGGPPRPDGTRK